MTKCGANFTNFRLIQSTLIILNFYSLVFSDLWSRDPYDVIEILHGPLNFFKKHVTPKLTSESDSLTRKTSKISFQITGKASIELNICKFVISQSDRRILFLQYLEIPCT